MLGKIQPAFFPQVFGPRGDEPLDARRRRARASPRWPPRSTRPPAATRTPEEVAEGFIDIAVGSMANAIKKISVARGYDVTRYTLQCFGGAGGQHACRVADALGMDARLRPSAGRRAVGLRHGPGRPDGDARGGGRAAARRRARRRSRRASTRWPPRRAAELAAPGRRPASASRVHRRVHVRYEGTDSALVVPFGDAAGDAARRSRPRTGSASRS